MIHLISRSFFKLSAWVWISSTALQHVPSCVFPWNSEKEALSRFQHGCIFLTIFAIPPHLNVLTWHPFSKRLENKTPTDFRASSEQGSYIFTGCQRHLCSNTSHKPQIERIKPFPGPNLTLRRKPFLMEITHNSFLRIFSLITLMQIEE